MFALIRLNLNRFGSKNHYLLFVLFVDSESEEQSPAGERVGKINGQTKVSQRLSGWAMRPWVLYRSLIRMF